MLKVKKIYLLSLLLLFVPRISLAHCPLCTVGAGALAILAATLGISSAIVGIMIGAFALALGLWMARLPKKQYIPYQYLLLTILIFLSTVIPIMPLVRDYSSLYINLGGEYGSLFNKTYMYNIFVAGALLGAAIVWLSPYASRLITKIRHGHQLPFQGLALTFLLLIIASAITQVLS